ncbi:hypothetical protein G7Z17_g11852 [Cylindrodendrum hubeiense]|uniref:Uncharacterized protein n=1 Tax=Cylindrodendrum hubeiense TaxID=595255 RepID=A0A9P5LAW2_9HYPO|nr:hypothetical protein G7Z17_g11852 [Cylindrodendrum hubeiense]
MKKKKPGIKPERTSRTRYPDLVATGRRWVDWSRERRVQAQAGLLLKSRHLERPVPRRIHWMVRIAQSRPRGSRCQGAAGGSGGAGMIGHGGPTVGPLPRRPAACANGSEPRGCRPGLEETAATLALFERTSARLQPSRTQSISLPADPIQTTPVGTLGRRRRRRRALSGSRRALIGSRRAPIGSRRLSLALMALPRPAETVARLKLEMGRSWVDLGPGPFGRGRVVRPSTGVWWVPARGGTAPNGSETVRREATGTENGDLDETMLCWCC